MPTTQRIDDAVSGSINAAFAARQSEAEHRLLSLINILLHERQFIAASFHLRGRRAIWTDIDRAYHCARAALAKARGEEAVEVCTIVIDAA
jgi:hypothetical protein